MGVQGVYHRKSNLAETPKEYCGYCVKRCYMHALRVSRTRSHVLECTNETPYGTANKAS